MPQENSVRKRKLREALAGLAPMQDDRQPPQPALQPPQQPAPLQPQQSAHPVPRRVAPAGGRIRERAEDDRIRQTRRALDDHAGDDPALAALLNIENTLAPLRMRGEIRFLGVSLENETYQREITGTWLRENVIPLVPSSEIPRLRTEDPSFFAQFERAFGYSIDGIYLGGTSEVHVSSRPHGEGDRLRVITHEDLHFFSRDGQRIAFQQENGRTARPGFIRWMHEGLTELFAQTITRENTFPPPTTIAYPYETLAAHYLLVAVSTAVGDMRRGREILLTAYITGDFTQVRVFTNMALGAGTFEQFVRMETGAEAFAFLDSRVPAPDPDGMLRMRGAQPRIHHVRTIDSQIARIARLQIGLENVSGKPPLTVGRD
jgi:hypothetical protein